MYNPMSRRKITLVVDAPDDITNGTVMHSIAMLLNVAKKNKVHGDLEHARYMEQLGGQIDVQSVADYTQPKSKLTVYTCPDHDYRVVHYNGKEVMHADYSTECLFHVVPHLGLEIERVELSDDEFERRFG